MDYPREYLLKIIEQEENTAFLIIPFKEEFNEVYGEVLDTCINMGINCKRGDEIIDSKPIMGNILEGITTSEIIIADITEKNPNVFYELGIAHSLRDQESVILITSDIKNCAFDVTHRSILIYDKRNYPKFKNDLKRRIVVSKKSSKRKEFFKTYLRNNGITQSEIELFIEKTDKLSQIRLDLIIDIIKSIFRDYEDSEIEELLEFFTLLEELEGGIIKKSASLLKMHVFSSETVLSRYETIAKKIFIKSKFDLIHLDDEETFSFVVEFCFKLIERGNLKSEALTWLIDYLHNYRMGRIDIIRSKIENFFTRTNDIDVDLAILSMLNSSKTTVKESAADICGQKKLFRAIPYLLNILKMEENPHVARSCITALTRLNAKEAPPIIHDWMISNQDKWGPQAVSGSLKSIALSALKELDDAGEYYISFQNLTRGSK